MMRLRDVESFLSQGRATTVSIFLILIGLIKSGVAFEVAAQSPDPAFPMPEPGIAPTSFGLPILVSTLQLTGNAAAIGLVMFALTAAALLLFALLLLQSDRDSGLIVAGLVLLGPIGVVALGNVGRHDWFLLVGSLLLAVKGRNTGWALLAAVLMVLGNPEQALLAVFGFFLLSNVPRFRSYRRSALWALAFVGVIAASLALWVEILGLDSRVSWLSFHLFMGLQNFFMNLPLSIYAAYGAGWILIFALMWNLKKKYQVFAFVALVAIPLFSTAVTFDQTRVFVGVSTVAAVVVFRDMAKESATWLANTFPDSWRSILVGLLILLPAIEITYAGSVRIPYEWIFDFVGDRSGEGTT